MPSNSGQVWLLALDTDGPYNPDKQVAGHNGNDTASAPAMGVLSPLIYGPCSDQLILAARRAVAHRLQGTGSIAAGSCGDYYQRSLIAGEEMRRLLMVLLLACGCSAPADDRGPPDLVVTVTGSLQNRSINEASGLARSQRDAALIWVINDGGKARVHATDATGTVRGHLDLQGARNRDWEDLASFSIDDVPYLLVADIGDNFSLRPVVTLYIVEEPDLSVAATQSSAPAWQVDFTYPDGPRDAESVAVDIANNRILVLSKRTIPAVLYELPLLPRSRTKLVAKPLGPVLGLPQPSRQDIKNAPKRQDWSWQPTGMDISADNRRLALVTESAVHFFERSDGEDWLDALQDSIGSIDIKQFPQAESVSFAPDNISVYLTTEQKNAPIFRIDTAPFASAPGETGSH